MDKFLDHHFKKVGALYNNGKCDFTVWAPLKSSVELLFPHNNQVVPLQEDEEGYWSVTVENIQPNQLYQYRIDGEKLPDVCSFHQPNGVHEASAIVDLNDFEWSDATWKGLALEHMIMYELHIGTFTEEGTFDAAINKLSYLKELGINAVEVMPIAQFPGNRNWGYDQVFPFAVQKNYGGLNGFKKFIDAAHGHGIAVILDVVYNHIGPEGNYLESYAPYFTDKYKTPWGKALNFDDNYCDGVRNYFLYNAWFWLYHCHVDGLRLDAVHAIFDSSAMHFLEALNQFKKAIQKETGIIKTLIAEFDLNNPRYTASEEVGGFGLDGQWVDEFHHALHALLTGERNGYYEDFGSIAHFHKTIKTGYVYTGEYSVTRKRKFGIKPLHNQPHQFVVFSQNHDHIGNRMMGDRLTASLQTDMLKLIAAAYMFTPFIPLIFMGEEYAEKNPFQYFVDHGNAELIEAVRKGRKEEFAYFHTEGQEMPDPFALSTIQRSTLSWNLNDARAADMLAYYKEIIHIRKTHGAFTNKTWKGIKVYDLIPDSNFVMFERIANGCKALVILNFDNQQQTVSIKVPAHLFFCSVPNAEDVVVSHDKIVVPAYSATIFNI